MIEDQTDIENYQAVLKIIPILHGMTITRAAYVLKLATETIMMSQTVTADSPYVLDIKEALENASV